jgi:filamentous hemagglutinin
VSLCIPPICYGSSSVSVSLSNAEAQGNCASVTEQSGIQAGDGGFQLDVKGGTSLQGGVIASSQQAIDDHKNSLSTQSITASDIANTDSHNATGFGVALSYSSSDKSQQGAGAQGSTGKSGPGFTGGIGQSSGSQSSSTKSSISVSVVWRPT